MHSPCLKIVAEAKGMEGRKRERVEDGGWVGAEREREGEGGRWQEKETRREKRKCFGLHLHLIAYQGC